MKNTAQTAPTIPGRFLWLLSLCCALLVCAAPAGAVEKIFNQTGTADWFVDDNWTPSGTPGTGDVAVFTETDGDVTVNLNANPAVSGIKFTNTGQTIIQGNGAANRIITVGADGIVVEPGAGFSRIGTNTTNFRMQVLLSTSQTWTNNSESIFEKSAGGGATDLQGHTLTFDGSGNHYQGANIRSFVGGVASGGTVIMSGTGQLTITSGSPDVRGGFILNSGITRIENSNALGGVSGSGPVTVNGTTVTLEADTFRSIQNVWTLDGDLALGGNRDLEFLGTVTFTGDRILKVEAAGTSRNLILSNVVSDGGNGYGLTKAGPHALVLNAPNTYTGQTIVSEGILFINGSHSAATGAVSVAAGAALAGSGSIFSNVTVDGAIAPSGFVRPDAVPGVLTVNGSVTMETGALARFAYGDPVSSRLDVTGTLSLAADMTVEVVAPGLSVPSLSMLLANAGTISGDPADVDLILPVGYAGELRAESGQLYIDLFKVPVLGGVVDSLGDLVITCPSVTGYEYQLEVSSNLSGWSSHGGPQDGNDGDLIFTVPGPANPGDKVFYRVQTTRK